MPPGRVVRCRPSASPANAIGRGRSGPGSVGRAGGGRTGVGAVVSCNEAASRSPSAAVRASPSIARSALAGATGRGTGRGPVGSNGIVGGGSGNGSLGDDGTKAAGSAPTV